jgi:hypothetical protein
LVLPAAARASPTPARLDYVLGTGASTCPTADVVRSSVAARLGYDPFTEIADRTISVRVERVGASLSARIELENQRGEAVGNRSLSSTQLDCSELASALALAITIAVDPKYLARQEPEPSEPAPVAPPPPAPPPPRPARKLPAPAAPTRRTDPPAWSVRGTLGVLGSVGTAPDLSVGATLGGGLRVAWWSLGAEGRFDAYASTEAGAGSGVRSSLRCGSLVPCAHLGPVLLCGLATAGEVSGEGQGVTEAREDASFFAALGARAALEVPVLSPIALRAHTDVQATLTEVHLELSGRRVWSTPPMSAALGLGIAGRYP